MHIHKGKQLATPMAGKENNVTLRESLKVAKAREKQNWNGNIMRANMDQLRVPPCRCGSGRYWFVWLMFFGSFVRLFLVVFCSCEEAFAELVENFRIRMPFSPPAKCKEGCY